MATYILVDTANTFFRARHVVRGSIDDKVGMAFHITLSGVKKAWRDFNADHVVFCLKLRKFYRKLMISEANHYTLFLKFAREFGKSREIVDQKWEALLDYEASIIKTLGDQETIHG